MRYSFHRFLKKKLNMPTRPHKKYNCTQQALYSIGNLAWDNCLAFISSFVAYKAKYVALFVTGKKTAIATASALPDDTNRRSPAELARLQLQILNDTCDLDFQKLKGYIEDGFPKAEWTTRFNSAGQTYYAKSANENWENTVGMNNNMNAFIALPANNALLLSPGGMPVGFAAQVTTDTGAFLTKYNAMKTARETGVATGGKVTANNAVYDDMQLMFHDAHRVFPTDAEKLLQFNFHALKNIVAPPGSASLKVTVQKPDNSFVAGVPVTIQSATGVPITVNTDADGVAHFDGIDPDPYRVTLNVATFVPVDEEKDVDTGVDARLVVKLELI